LDGQQTPLTQLRRKKNVKKGISFSIMVVGASGTGRTTFINSLCGVEVLSPQEYTPEHAHLDPGIEVQPRTVDLDEEDGTRVTLTIVDTPGFGDNINNDECFDAILKYLEHQYDDILSEESRIRRNPRFKDNRVHVLLYFIEATGHGLRELDVELMKRLSKRVNIIPVIGRSDALTPAEVALNKRLIMDDVDHHQIPIYNFPFDPEDDDEETIEENTYLRKLLPFAIVSGNAYAKGPNGEDIPVRAYPWGNVEIENPEHSDFVALKSALLGSHLQDLKLLTHDFLYENYRTERLSKGYSGPNPSGAHDDSLNPEELANQSYMLKEEQLAREEEKLREIELRVQKEINEKKLELLAREQELREIEARIARERQMSSNPSSPQINPDLIKQEPGENGATIAAAPIPAHVKEAIEKEAEAQVLAAHAHDGEEQ
jgi:cell division control protein 11